MIADEPTGNLDSKNTLEVMNIIKSISEEKLVILVTHEEQLADFYASRIIRIRDGKVISDEINEHAEDVYKRQYFYRMIKDGYDLMVPYHMLRYPVIFASMAMKGCVESGKSVQEGGAKYSTAGMFITGSANLADSIVAIEDVVYKDHDVTMDQLIEALDKNFEGEERLRQLLINKPPKYGNDNEYVDGVATVSYTHLDNDRTNGNKRSQQS